MKFDTNFNRKKNEICNSLTRKELYDLVWSTAISKILERFALSNDD